jgi:hypothetical protein
MFEILKTQKNLNPMSTKFKLLSVASIIAGCGLASSAFAQSLNESATAPTGNVILQQLVGGSTSGSPGASGHDYLNNPPPGETFTLGSAATLDAVTVQGNGDAGYWSGSAFYGTLGSSPITAGLQWQLQIGSVSGTTITPIVTEQVNGFAPAANNTFLTFTLASPISLAAGQEYAFSMNLNNALSNGGDSTWYGLSESLTPQIGAGNAFNNGATVGSFGNTVAPITTGNPGQYDFVFVLQSVPEPGTMALIALGGLGLLAFRRRA